VLTCLLVLGCSTAPEKSAPPSVPSGLRDALGFVAVNPAGRTYVEYADNAAVNELLRRDPTRFMALRTAGLFDLGLYARSIADQVGIDPDQMRVRIVVRQDLDKGGRWWGDYDVGKVDSWFADHGGKREDKDGRTQWRTAEDHKIDLAGPLGEVAPLGSFNLVRTGPGSFAWATATSTLAAVTTPGADTLDKDPAMRAVADCLGNVPVAIITRDGGATFGVGVRADLSEAMCAQPEHDNLVAAMRENAERKLREGTSTSGEPYSTLLPQAAVTLTGSTVQLSWRPSESAPAGRSLTMLGKGEVLNIFLH
jgi:hypothetical protein